MHDGAMNPPIDLTSPEACEKALTVFFRIATSWGLSDDEQVILLGTTRSAFASWRKAPLDAVLHRDTLERLSLIFGIYSALHVLFPIPERADSWIRKKNSAPVFGGESALQRMLAGQVSDIYVVRHYLDAQAEGGIAIDRYGRVMS